MILFNNYITKEYFTTPADSIANASVILVALLCLHNKANFLYYHLIIWLPVMVIAFGIIAIFFKDSRTIIFGIEVKRIPFAISSGLGNAKFIFSIVYIAAVASYFPNLQVTRKTDTLWIIFAITLWIMLMFFDVFGLAVNKLTNLLGLANKLLP